MFKANYIPVLFSLLMATGNFAYADAAENDKTAITQTLKQYEDALNHSNTEKIVSLYTQDGIQMSPDQPAFIGTDALRSAYEHTFKQIKLNLAFTTEELELLNEHTAMLRSRSDGAIAVVNPETPAKAAAFKELFIFKKQTNGEWKISRYSFNFQPTKN